MSILSIESMIKNGIESRITGVNSKPSPYYSPKQSIATQQNTKQNFSSLLNQHLESSKKIDKEISKVPWGNPLKNTLTNSLKDSSMGRLEDPKKTVSSEPTLSNHSSNYSKDRLKELSYEFESLLIRQMLKSMKQGLKQEQSLFHGGETEKIFDELLDDHYALEMSKSSQFGLADALYRELTARIS